MSITKTRSNNPQKIFVKLDPSPSHPSTNRLTLTTLTLCRVSRIPGNRGEKGHKKFLVRHLFCNVTPAESGKPLSNFFHEPWKRGGGMLENRVMYDSYWKC